MEKLMAIQRSNDKGGFPDDLVCFSHLRWQFVYQRPQHLLSRFAGHLRVFYFEEPVFGATDNTLNVVFSPEKVWIITPNLKSGMKETESTDVQKELISDFFKTKKLDRYILWYYTPMALAISDHLQPQLIVYDCMDELSAFKFAPASLKESECRLLKKADMVFTGGHSLYEAKKNTHPHIFPFPSSIDKEHFGRARSCTHEPEDQQHIPHPRFGFFGVIDERMNIDLIARVAESKPAWHFVFIGPIVKIDPSLLPARDNIHYLGGKSYQELPQYLSGWDIAMIPFAKNKSTQFISPTKTPEYLAAGKPVISTSIRDVVNPYGKRGLVHIADTPRKFIAAANKELDNKGRNAWLKKVDIFLRNNSWNNTWQNMMDHLTDSVSRKFGSVLNGFTIKSEFTNRTAAKRGSIKSKPEKREGMIRKKSTGAIRTSKPADNKASAVAPIIELPTTKRVQYRS